jgi:hypothetical protein
MRLPSVIAVIDKMECVRVVSDVAETLSGAIKPKETRRAEAKI